MMMMMVVVVVAAGRGARETPFEWRKFGTLLFALQCVSVSLYLLVSALRSWRRNGTSGHLPKTAKTLAPPLSVCLSVCSSVNRIIQKLLIKILYNFVKWLDIMQGAVD